MADDRVLRKALIRAPLSGWASSLEQLDTKLCTKFANWESLILYQARLSHFVDSDQLTGQMKSLSYRDNVDIGLFQILRPNRSRHIKRPCVALDAPENYSESKRRILNEAGIQYVCLPAQGETIPGARLAEIETAWSTTRAQNRRENDHLDLDEADNIPHLLQLLRPLSLRYLPQQGLTEVFDIPESVREKMRNRVNTLRDTKKISEEFVSLTTVDGVIATPPPACIPIAIIEFDGGVHRNPDTMEGRAKIIKDKIKNGIAASADFPLIRMAVGRDIDEQSKSVGWRVLNTLLTEMRNIFHDDEHQALALHEMVFSEVRSLASDKSQNIEAMLSEYLGVLQLKAKATESTLKDSLNQASNTFDPELMDQWRDYEPWHEEGFTSEAEYLECKTLEWYDPQRLPFSVPNYDDSVPLLTYYERSIDYRRHESFAWRCVARYTKRNFGLKYVDRAMKCLQSQFVHDLGFIFPIRAFGSKLAKAKLSDLIYREALAALRTFEAEKGKEICATLSPEWQSAEKCFFFDSTVSKIVKLSTSRSVINLIEKRIGLLTPRALLVDNLYGAVSVDYSKIMLARKDESLRALRAANRSDFSDEEIVMLSDDLDDQIRKCVNELRDTSRKSL